MKMPPPRPPHPCRCHRRTEKHPHLSEDTLERCHCQLMPSTHVDLTVWKDMVCMSLYRVHLNCSINGKYLILLYYSLVSFIKFQITETLQVLVHSTFNKVKTKIEEAHVINNLSVHTNICLCNLVEPEGAKKSTHWKTGTKERE